MKLFYIISLIIVGSMVLSPLWFLQKVDTKELQDLTVSYGTYASKIKSLDPATCGDTSSAFLQGAFYEGLLGYYFLKRPIELKPQLAEEFPSISQDKLTYTFKIKKSVKYHRNPCFGIDESGQAKTRTVTAEDFVLSFKRIADSHINTEMSLAFIQDKIVGINEYREKTKSYNKGDFTRYDELSIKGVRALDAQTFQIRLATPFPQLLYVLAINNYAPVPREVIDFWLETRDDGKGGREPIPMRERTAEITTSNYQAVVGTGAYYLKQFVDGGTNILMRNPDYRDVYYPSEGTDAQREAGLLKDAGKKLPLIDVRYLTYVPELNPMWMLFLTKQSDACIIPREVYSQVITPSKELTDTWSRQGIRLEKYRLPLIYWIVFNNEDPILGTSKSLRQALQLAYNVEAEIRILRNGRAVRTSTYIPSSFEGYAQAPSPYAKFDLTEAKKKLLTAKKELAAAGLLTPDGKIPPITLDMGGLDAETRKRGEFAQQQFRQIGIKLNIELNDWPTLQSKVHNKKCQMYNMGWHADYPDPQNFLQLYYGPNIKRGTNNSNYSNPRFDRLFEKISTMGPSPQRTAIYVEMLKILNEDCPVLLQTEPALFFLVHSWVGNVLPHPIGYGMRKFRSLDIEKRRREGGR